MSSFVFVFFGVSLSIDLFYFSLYHRGHFLFKHTQVFFNYFIFYFLVIVTKIKNLILYK